MKLHIFESDKGDCLLLEARTGELVLCDGGMKNSMRKHVSPALAKHEKQQRPLELVYVSHIDNDHISGVLQLLEDEVKWRVYLHHAKRGDKVKPPKEPRPPVIKGILHNAFRDMITENNKPMESLTAARAVEDLLTTMAPPLYGTAVPELIQAAAELESIATGVPEAIQVSKLAAADALDIPVNKPPGVRVPARLLYAGRPGQVFQLGSMKFTLIGPTRQELDNLRKGWNNWLRENQARVKEIRSEIKKRVDEFSNGALSSSPFDLRDWNGIPDTKGVTAPNVASLMYLVEEDGKTLLLTGDAQQDSILAGLERTGFLQNGHVHLNVLKVQHHGSENNMDDNFAKQVSADNYVFCGNGEHGNPNPDVIRQVFDSRVGPKASPDAPTRQFHFWFSTTGKAQTKGTDKRDNFLALEKELKRYVTKSKGRLKLHFNQGASIALKI